MIVLIWNSFMLFLSDKNVFSIKVESFCVWNYVYVKILL